LRYKIFKNKFRIIFDWLVEIKEMLKELKNVKERPQNKKFQR
jgi:hypothetical protein